MDCVCVLDENELYNIFCQVLEFVKGCSIIVCIMDIGGDKFVDYLNIFVEVNLFFGYCVVCIYEEYVFLFIIQLCLIFCVFVYGNLKIMILMIFFMEEILWVKEKLVEVKQQLCNEYILFDEKILFGIMLEVLLVMFIID